MHETDQSHSEATRPPLTLLRPEVLRRLQAHDREAEGYAQAPPGQPQEGDR